MDPGTRAYNVTPDATLDAHAWTVDKSGLAAARRTTVGALKTFLGFSTDILGTAAGGTGGGTAAAARIGLGLRAVRGPDALNIVATGGGGTGTIGFNAGTGYPGIESFPLTTRADGTCWIEADLVDRAGGLLERGWYRVNPTARTLARNRLLLTGNGAASVVAIGGTGTPSAVSIPDGAEIHFRVFGDMAPLWSGFRSTWAGAGTLGAASPILTTFSNAAVAQMYQYFTPYPWPGGFVRTAGLYCGTPTAASACAWGIYEAATSGTGGAGSNLLNSYSSFGSNSWLLTTTAGEVTVTVQKFFPRQVLWTCMLFSAAVSVMNGGAAVAHPWGTSSGLPLGCAYKANTWTGAAADIPTTAPTSFDATAGSGPALYLMPG
jgi:hypothetical protein